jgi:hypothetical protein
MTLREQLADAKAEITRLKAELSLRGDVAAVHGLAAADRSTMKTAIRLQEKLTRIPMPEILAKVPGETVVEKAAQCGVVRQTYYRWLEGASRPNSAQSDRIAGLTGYSVKEVSGKG